MTTERRSRADADEFGDGMADADEFGDGMAEVLLALRLLGFATVEVLAAHPCGPESVASTEAALRRAAGLGWVAERDRPSGWSLSTDGRVAGEQFLAGELFGRRVHDQFEGWYRSFLPLNERLLAVCTRWQLRMNGDGDEVVNDHLDATHDASVVAQLEQVLHEAADLLDNIAIAVDRFDSYVPRFDHALERIRRGDHDWFARPMIDSFHTVWFELHEHLLATLGVTRHQERSANSFVAPDRAE